MARKETKTWETEKAVFPSRLSELMRDQKVSQEKLANALGVKRQTVSLYKTGQSSPNVEQLRIIAGFFKVSSDWLLGLTDDKFPQPRTVDMLGISSSALDKLMDISEYFPEILSDALSSDSFRGLISQINRLKKSVLATKQAHEIVHKKGLCVSYEEENALKGFEGIMSDFLGYPVSFVEPRHALYGKLDSVKMLAENLAKEISGYNSLSYAELFDSIYDFEKREVEEFFEYIRNKYDQEDN